MTEPGPTLAVLRFPRTPVQGKGRDVVTDQRGAPVVTMDASRRGRQVDVCAPDGAPLGRILEVGRGRWQLTPPGTAQPVADADVRRGLRVRIGAGPVATVKGAGEEWDLVWEHTTLLAARHVPRKVAKRSLDVWVTDPACTPAVVAFVVHVHRWWSAEEASNQLLMQQTMQSIATPPPTTY